MKVFISWSGDLSHRVAVALRDWLPETIQSLKPYVSSEDIDKGARWSTDIAKELEDSSYGILCITSENIDAPWLNFEAGALSKSIDKSRVSPFLFGVKRSKIKGPILQFQSTVFNKADVKKLIHSMYEADEDTTLDETRLDNIFEVWWPQLERALNDIPIAQETDSSSGDTEKVSQAASARADILEEVLELVRQQHRILSSPNSILPEGYLRDILSQDKGLSNDHPVFKDLAGLWRRLETMIRLHDTDDHNLADQIREAALRLGDPIEYILDATDNIFHKRPRRFRGSRLPFIEEHPTLKDNE